MYKFIGLMFANGLTPWSNLDSWFCSTPNRPIYDASFVKGVFEKRKEGAGSTDLWIALLAALLSISYFVKLSLESGR
jgi:hypothetical protein